VASKCVRGQFSAGELAVVAGVPTVSKDVPLFLLDGQKFELVSDMKTSYPEPTRRSPRHLCIATIRHPPPANCELHQAKEPYYWFPACTA
jgi:hypothetical protein